MSRTKIPELAECHMDRPPVPKPLYWCWHPEADDCFNVGGGGQTPQEAYADMLESLYLKVCDDFETDAQADAFYAEIQKRSKVVTCEHGERIGAFCTSCESRKVG
jgi:hypothetical protein